MSAVVDILERIESAPRGNARKEELARHIGHDGLRKVLLYALSPYMRFYMQKLPEPIAASGGASSFDDLWALLDRLSSRELSGDAARREVAHFLGGLASPIELKWAKRILLKDLRLNIDTSTVASIEAGVVPLFQVPLAKSYKDLKHGDFDGAWAIQPKLDGIRIVARIPNDGEVQLLSRTGLDKTHSLSSIIPALKRAANIVPPGAGDLYLDGEVVALSDGKVDFQALQTVMHAKSKKTKVDIGYAIWDAAYERDWMHPQQPYCDRYCFASTVAKYIRDGGFTCVDTVPSDLVNELNNDVLMGALDKWLALGYEGAMARRWDAPVAMDRSKRLVKVKDFCEEEFMVVSTFQGRGRLEGMVGGYVVDLGNGLTAEVGSGITNEESAAWTEDPSLIVGKVVTVKFFERTRDGSLRFPVHKGIREPGT